MKQSFEVTRLKSGEATLRWVEGGETFHPDIGAEEEGRLMIVEQLQLDRLFAGRSDSPLRVWDVGLGAAGNAAAVLGAWKKQGGRSLELVSFDNSMDPLRTAWEAHREDRTHFPWLERFPFGELLESGGTAFVERESRAEWKLLLGDFAGWMREDPDPSLEVPDFIIYDFFSPARNYSLWTLDHWRNLRRRLSGDHDTRIVFHSRSTALRVTLLLAGFYVGRGAALGKKEETTLASTRMDGGFPLLEQFWLDKVAKSSSSEPFVGLEYRASAISEIWLRQLLRHPQFARIPL